MKYIVRVARLTMRVVESCLVRLGASGCVRRTRRSGASELVIRRTTDTPQTRHRVSAQTSDALGGSDALGRGVEDPGLEHNLFRPRRGGRCAQHIRFDAPASAAVQRTAVQCSARLHSLHRVGVLHVRKRRIRAVHNGHHSTPLRRLHSAATSICSRRKVRCMAWLDTLGDDELRARLEQRGVAADEVEALVDWRDDDDARRVIVSYLE